MPERNCFMAIIYRKPKGEDGPTYAYETTSYWVPELKQPRSTRKYLGVVDEATGEIVPSSGRRGRKAGVKVKNSGSSEDCSSDALAKKDQQIKSLKEEIALLQKENRQYRELLNRIHTISKTGE